MNITAEEWKTVVRDSSEFYPDWYGHIKPDGTYDL